MGKYYQNKCRHVPKYDNIHIEVFPNLCRELTGMHSFAFTVFPYGLHYIPKCLKKKSVTVSTVKSY
jgi:hypothetical protein